MFSIIEENGELKLEHDKICFAPSSSDFLTVASLEKKSPLNVVL